MWNPIRDLIEAYHEGRNKQLKLLKKELVLLERIAEALEKLVQTR